MCQDVSSAEESAFPAPTVLVKSGSVDAVPSRQAVSVLWNLFKIKSVVSYLLSWNRIVLVFIVTISKVRKGYRSLQRDRETPLGFQGSFDFIPLVCMHLICNIIGVMWALEMGKHWPSSGRAWHLWFLGIDFRGGWVMSPRLLTGDAGSWLPVLDFVEWLSGWLGGLLSNTQQGFFKWYFHTRGIVTTQNGLWSWPVQKNYWMSLLGSVLRPGASGMNWTEPVLCSLGVYSLEGGGQMDSKRGSQNKQR